MAGLTCLTGRAAAASGVTPKAGIYRAIIAGFLGSLLGGSPTQTGGPTGAFVVILSELIAKFGLPGLFMVSMMTGVGRENMVANVAAALNRARCLSGIVD